MPESYLYSPGQEKLTGPVRAELDKLLDTHGTRWAVVGPTLDGGWYAWPRGDVMASRLNALTLAELTTKIEETGR